MRAPDPKARSEPHSGRLLLRMPTTLHAELARRAEVEGVSLNQLIVGALSRAVGAPEPTAGPPAGAVAPPAQTDLRVALIANLIVVGLAAAAAIVLLLVAWHRGL